MRFPPVRARRSRALHLRPRLLFPLAVAALLVLAAPASASGGDVIQDCTQNGTLTRHYSQRDYQEALASLPADVDEYGNCGEIIRNAATAAAADHGGEGKGRGGNATSSAATLPPTGSPTPPSGGGGAASTRGAPGTSTAQGDDPTAIDPANPTTDNPGVPSENQALIDATRNGGGAIKVGRDAIQPGAENSSFAQGMPTPLLGVLALLGVAALAAGALALRRKLRASGR